MKILVTGSTGFIGRKLVPYLSSKYQVVGINENINDVNALEPHFPGIDLVIHLVSKLKKVGGRSENKDFYEVNVLGTLNVARLCAKYGCKLINFSSISALVLPNDYGISKLLAEKLLESYARTYGLQAVTIRPCGLYDENYRDLGGNRIRPAEGKWYPIGKLLKDIDKLIVRHNFSKYKAYDTKLLMHKIHSIKRHLRIK